MSRRLMMLCLCALLIGSLAACKDDGSNVALGSGAMAETPGGGSASDPSDDQDSADPDPDTPDEDQPFAGPALQTSQAELDAALNCTEFAHPDKPPVLLVHGTTVTGTEEYTTFYTPQLVERGFDVCIVTYPDRGLGDMQISAEYVVNALRSIHAETSRKVAMIGHSQGGLMPRWAIKYWPSARDALADFVMIAGPNHGTAVALPATIAESLLGLLQLDRLPVGAAPAVTYQFARSSDFVAALNAGDETPGDIDYTSLYTLYDELVQPVAPTPTAALEYEQGNAQVANILLQDVCPSHVSEHFLIGTADSLAFALALDAISNPGPADIERAGGASGLCGLLPVDIEELAMPSNVTGLLNIVATTVQDPMLAPHLALGEPPLKDYARGDIEP